MPPSWISGEAFGRAQGDVLVPSGQTLGLAVDPDLDDYSPLAHLAADDLQALVVGRPGWPPTHRQPTNDDLRYVAGLTGLRALSLNSGELSDAGVLYLADLVGLRSLENCVASGPTACLSV